MGERERETEKQREGGNKEGRQTEVEKGHLLLTSSDCERSIPSAHISTGENSVMGP